MKTVRESTTLYNFLGSHNPYWRLTESSDVLRFSTTETTEPDRTLQLSAEQAARIREMTVITSSLMMSLTVDESDLSVHLVGRKINKREWAGNASAWHDTPAVARDLSHGLSFAEQVVSEAHSAIVILDSRGNIQRFNRLCEDYTGLKEHDVIGQSVFKLFMSRREAAASRRNNRVFFRSGNAYEVELWIPTCKGQRLFLFRNKFVHSGSGKNEIFLICSGTDITEERRAQERLRILANTDSITGLPNRNAMQDLIDHAINHADNNKVGVVYLDVPLGRWVILDVVRQVAKWRDKGINLRVAVNISARQLADQTIFTALKQVLQELNFEYCPIDVELTESCLIENDELALSVIQQFSQLGAQVHLDDFGTGYSSLSQLARFPIDAIKLDQVFVRDIHKQPVSQSLVRAIVAVAQALNLQVIAEGVESAKEDAFLTKNGINERQGFLFAKPMPAVAFERWYKRYLKRA
ncbi:TPA: EAL domain-containing protein [Escherichia coli]|nr:EAL domain-containing protein [Escherichia coli]HCZ4591182.1 EAL domain-containing protein [Escherichia coli]